MKTFNQELKDFTDKYSYEKLYLANTYSNKNMKWLKRFLIFFIICFIIGDIMMIVKFYPKIGNIIMLISAFPTIVYIFIIQTYQARKELRTKELPLPNEFYKWKSEELESLRINQIYKEYSKTEDNVLNAKIKLAKELKNEPINNPFNFLDKVLEFMGKQFVLVIIAVMLFLYKKNNSTENLNVLLRYVVGILLLSGLIAFIWEYLLKKPYFDNKLSKKNKLKDFIFVLENILLMKKEK